MSVMMAMGKYIFALSSASYQRLAHRSAQRWAEHQVVAGPPLGQYLGPGSSQMRLSGTVYPHFRGGLGQISMMRAEAAGIGDGPAQAHMLASISGRLYGRYCILNVGETQKHFTASGAPARIDFTLILRSVGAP